MSLKDIIAPFAIWKRVFEKPYTIPNPVDERPGAPRYRGFHINDIDKCIGCGSCEAICQNAAIDLVPVEGVETKDGDSGLRPQIDYGRCCWCALCVDICTTSSLNMSNEYLWIDSDPEVFRFVPGADEKSWNNSKLGYRRNEHYRLLNPDREDMNHMSGEQRVESFLEMMMGYSREQALQEADRCVECGICISTCPANMDIPGYIRAIRENELEEGLRLMYKSNPFPASCGRVCTHRCEDVCAMGHNGEPIAIRWLKRYIADQVELKDYKRIIGVEAEDSGKKVAVVGSGPGGLSAAYYLRNLGYQVTVFESLSQTGGMLRYGIPEYRLPYDQLDKDVEFIRSLGVEIRLDTKIGKTLPFADLTKDYDAVFFSTGLPEPYSLGIDGEEHPSVITGISLLKDVTDGKKPDIGKSVAVIGGGNVAMDAARTARRFGCEVSVIYRRREEDMPADEEEIVEAKEEAVRFITQAIPLRVESGDGGKVNFIYGLARMIDSGDTSRPRPELIEGSEKIAEVDTIITAIGQGPDYSFLPEDSGVDIKRYRTVTGAGMQTGSGNIFAGGDIVNNQKDAISAIADGHKAARGIDAYLQRQ